MYAKKNVMTFDARLRHRLLRIYTHTSFVIEDFKYYKSMNRLAIYKESRLGRQIVQG